MARKIIAARILFDHLTDLPEKVRARVSKVLLESASVIEQDVKGGDHMAPYESGNLRRSYTSRLLAGGLTAVVESDPKVAYYAPFLEFGTGIYCTYGNAPKREYIIRPRKKRALYWEGAAHPVKWVKHPGIRPRPHLRPAVEAEAPRLQEQIEQLVKDAASGK